MAQHVIHPNPGGPTHAQSPYQRKLTRLREDIQNLLTVAPTKDGAELVTIAGILDSIIERN